MFGLSTAHFFVLMAAVPSPASSPARARRPGRSAPSTPTSRRTRQEHLQETAQDYVELIADLIGETGEARVIDLARRLGVTHVTGGAHDPAAPARGIGDKPAVPLHFPNRRRQQALQGNAPPARDRGGRPALAGRVGNGGASRRRGDRTPRQHGNARRVRQASRRAGRKSVLNRVKRVPIRGVFRCWKPLGMVFFTVQNP